MPALFLLEYASDSLGNLVKKQILIQEAWGAPDSAFLTSSQVTLVLQV